MSNPIIRKCGIVLLCAILLNACSKPDQQVDPATLPNFAPTELVNISLQGRITDQQSSPIAGAVVRSGNHVTTTDINGRYRFNSIQVKPSSGLVEVAVNGYFREFKGFEVLPGTEHYVKLRMEPINNGIEFEAATGTEYRLPSGSAIRFAADAMTDAASGQVYNGSVRANAFSKETDDSSFFAVIPGTRGKDLQNRSVSVQVMSVVVTELKGGSGQELQLKPGKSASVQFPIPASKLADAPSSISLWYYDPIRSEWKEEGKAQKQGSYYVAQVPHFSTWACGTALPAAPIKATITDNGGEAMSFARIHLFNRDGSEMMSSPVHTNDKGELLMNAPSNQELEIRIINNCDEVLATKKINTRASSNQIGTIRAGNGGGVLVLSGKVQNCKSSSVYRGWVTVQVDGQLYKAAVSNGNFSLSLNRCHSNTTTAKITAVDEDGNLESNTINMEVSTGTVDLGVLSTCNKRNMQFISYTMNGTNYLLQAPEDSLVQTKGNADNVYIINAYKADDPSNVSFSMSFNAAQKTGDYTVTALKFNQNKTQLTNTGTWQVKITRFGKPGEYIEGTANGNMRELSSNRTLPFTFKFKVIRNQ